MNSEISVTVSSYGRNRKYLMMRYQDPVTGERHARSTGTANRREAERVAAKWEAELREGRYAPPSKITWEDFTWRYTDEVVPGMKPNSRKMVATTFNTVERILAPRRLVDVDAPALSRLQTQLRAENKSEETVKSYLAYLRPALAWAVDMGMLSKVPKFPRRGKGKRASVMKGRPLIGEEFDRLLATTEKVVGPEVAPSWKRLLTGLWLSGLRLEEAVTLYWDRTDRLHVDLSGRRPMLVIPGELEKGGRDRLLPITPDFAEFLYETPAGQRTGRVFRARSPREPSRTLSLKSISRMICRIGQLTRIKVHVHPTTGRVKFASAHDLRRSFGARWAVRVMPQVLKELMRHSNIQTTMTYYVGRNAQATADAVWEAWEASGNTCGNTWQGIAQNAGKKRRGGFNCDEPADRIPLP